MRIKNLLSIFQLLIMTILLSNCVIPFGSNSRAPKSQTADSEGIRATLWTNHYCYEWGEPIQIKFTLENITDETITFGGKDSLPIDIVVYRSTSQYEVRWSQTNSAPTTIELKPEEVYMIEWSVTLPDKEDYGIYGDLGRYSSHLKIPITILNAQSCPEGINMR